MVPVGPDDQTDLFSRSKDPQNLNYGASSSQRPNQPIFKVKRALERVNPPFCQFLNAIVHVFLSDPELRCDCYKKNS
ncbi:hypothetical protein H5410_012943 [Solanum commersonii]|uniref:Uncharacterized protein n=1 Tax=Solanum commersonii TaxID=4109 RepID=A0A9J6AT23_SOLCO|nr:hypothetical protein H5410_012943 [Solanum commersonii]